MLVTSLVQSLKNHMPAFQIFYLFQKIGVSVTGGGGDRVHDFGGKNQAKCDQNVDIGIPLQNELFILSKMFSFISSLCLFYPF